jgi:hypothetical protein
MGWPEEWRFAAGRRGCRFEVFLTADKKLSYQQNLKGRAFAVVVLSMLDWEIMKPHLGKIAAAVDVATLGSFQFVECGNFKR